MAANIIAIISPVVRPLPPPPLLVGAAVVGENDSVGEGVVVGEAVPVGDGDGTVGEAVPVGAGHGAMGEEVVGGGDAVGEEVGDDGGKVVGEEVAPVGEAVGCSVGENVGSGVGEEVGCGVGAGETVKLITIQQLLPLTTAGLHTMPGTCTLGHIGHVFVVFNGTQFEIIIVASHSCNLAGSKGNG